ncbi:MAG TPA: methyltransferase domain-containing protein [Ktedonobacteraceae bacterium]|nr:methyltransferase domain-containing protein [Ktedonobacteraceae bacterium]
MSDIFHESSAPTGTITMYATRWCGDCRRSKRWLDTHGIRYDVIDIDCDDRVAAYVIQADGGLRSVPTIVFPDGSVLVEPTSRELAAQCSQMGARPEQEEGQNSLENHKRGVSSDRKARSSPRFAAFYNWLMGRPLVRRMFDPLRREVIGQAHGAVLEVGAGGGQNFPWYNPAHVERVEAVEPDEAMLATARRRLEEALVPITITSASVETLPFPDAQFDCVVATLVFCSVDDPERGLREIWRVLKPGGTLLLLEHVCARGKVAAWIQGALVPLTTRFGGNCRWNRETGTQVLRTGFQTIQVRTVREELQPMLLLHAVRPEA